MKSAKSTYYDDDYYSQRHTGIDPYLSYVLKRQLICGNKAKTALDIGCGTGVYVDFFKQAGLNSYGIDFSFDASKISGQINASALNLPFRDKTFDIVLSVHMLEHLTEIDGDKFLKESKRVLKDSGSIFIMTPNAMCPGKFILKDKWFPDPSHINIYNPFRLMKILKKNGFKRIKNIFFLPLNKIKLLKSDIVDYYGLRVIFEKIPFLQNLLFFLLFSTPLAYFRDVNYFKAQAEDK